ncbi:hypothetical protein FIBSPDRAFT_999279, partial [Athelia psychrophila]
VLWIGSRVPESLVTACKPGNIFVHRNIANQFHLDDDSAQSVLSYAITALGVQHVLVVHTHCGGAAACMFAARTPSTSRSPTLRPAAGPLRSCQSPHVSSRRPRMCRSMRLWRRTYAARSRTCPRPRRCKTRGRAGRRCGDTRTGVQDRGWDARGFGDVGGT